MNFVDRNEGTLHINIRHAPNDEIFGPPISERRISIHPTDNSSEYNTIKQTFATVRENSTPLKTYAYCKTSALKKNSFQIVFARHIPDLGLERYDFPARAKDQIIHLCSYKGSVSLLMCLSVSAREANLYVPGSTSYRTHRLDIGRFTISVTYTFCYVPTNPLGHYISELSSPPEKEGTRLRYGIPIISGTNPSVVRDAIKSRFRETISATVRKLLSLSGDPSFSQFERYGFGIYTHEGFVKKRRKIFKL